MSYNYEKERQEAIVAGRRALQSLYKAKEQLNSAKNWGWVDLFGGGFFTDMMKHSKMNTAQRYIDEARFNLQSFSRELNDLSGYVNINVDTTDFLTFADYFFDGVFADWMMQNRINNARNQVDEAIRQVEFILHKL